MLLLLPFELRQKIYRHVFSSVEIRPWCGENVNLSLLRTCRLVYAEAAPLWLGCATFQFEDIEELLDQVFFFDKMPILTAANVARIRHLALECETGLAWRRCEHLRLPNGLPLLENLALDSLTVIAPGTADDGTVTYRCLNELTKYPHGWRELRFFMTKSNSLDVGRCAPEGSWIKYLLQHDAKDALCRETIIKRSNGSNEEVAQESMVAKFMPASISEPGMAPKNPAWVINSEDVWIVVRRDSANLGIGTELREKLNADEYWKYELGWNKIRDQVLFHCC